MVGPARKGRREREGRGCALSMATVVPSAERPAASFWNEPRRVTNPPADGNEPLVPLTRLHLEWRDDPLSGYFLEMA